MRENKPPYLVKSIYITKPSSANRSGTICRTVQTTCLCSQPFLFVPGRIFLHVDMISCPVESKNSLGRYHTMKKQTGKQEQCQGITGDVTKHDGGEWNIFTWSGNLRGFQLILQGTLRRGWLGVPIVHPKINTIRVKFSDRKGKVKFEVSPFKLVNNCFQ